MSTPKKETAEPKPAPAVKQKKLTPAQAENKAAAELHAGERAARESLTDAQLGLARQRRLDKLARKDPAIAEILDQNKACAAVIDELRGKLVKTEADKESAIELLEEAGKVNQAQAAELAAAKESLAAALKPKTD